MEPIQGYDDWKLASPDDDTEQEERDITDRDGWDDPDYDDFNDY
jgi:hypothetical protein